MWKKSLTAAATAAATVAVAVVAFAGPAMAQTVCSDRAKFLDHLARGYQEAPAAMGLASNGAVLEVLTSESGTWTIILTMPTGTSCVVASGEAWEKVEKIAMVPGT